jgi:hypothetical protein
MRDTRLEHESEAARRRPDRAEGDGERRVELGEVLELIEKLPEEDRIALSYYHWDDHSERSFADAWGCSRRKAARHREQAHERFVWLKCRLDPVEVAYFTYDEPPPLQRPAAARPDLTESAGSGCARTKGASRNGTMPHRPQEKT